MTPPPDDDDELNGLPLETDERGDSGTGKKGKQGETGAAGVVGAIKLTAQQTKEVWAVFRQMSGQELVDAVVEFFSEGPMRASANLAVNFVKSAASSVKSFAIVNWAIEAGKSAVRDFERTRDRGMGAAGRGRDSRGLIQRRAPKAGARPAIGVTPGLNGPTGAQ